jgi:hypothetical protein
VSERDEIERLRNALQRIEALPSCDGETEEYRQQQDMRLVEQARMIARAALIGDDATIPVYRGKGV